MKAVQIQKFGGPEVLEIVDIKEPELNTDEIKIKLYSAGINPNERYTISGNYGYFVPELPYVPGFDGAGVVEEIGENVESFQKGDRVFLNAFTAKRNTGTYAEKVVVSQDVVHRLPDNISFNQGAALGIPAFAAYRALIQRAEVKAGETVLIHGASGAVGTLITQMAKAIGAIVIGTSSTKKGQELIKENGADYSTNHVTEDNIDEIKELTDGKGPDIIIEMLANKNLAVDMKMISDFGRIVIVGSRDTIKVDPRMLMTNQATVTGLSITNPSHEELNEIIAGVTAMLDTGALSPMIGKKYTLEEATRAHEELKNSSGAGRFIFEIKE